VAAAGTMAAVLLPLSMSPLLVALVTPMVLRRLMDTPMKVKVQEATAMMVEMVVLETALPAVASTVERKGEFLVNITMDSWLTCQAILRLIAQTQPRLAHASTVAKKGKPPSVVKSCVDIMFSKCCMIIRS